VLFVAVAAVDLIPVMLTAAAVTIVVGVTVYVGDEIIDAARRRRKREKLCWDQYYECLKSPWQPEWNIPTYGKRKPCPDCLGGCLKRRGDWDYAKCPMTN
jgi:hypothetical protein